ncbi:FCS-Like Zinc finger 8 [Linum grandiflorum]
MLIRNRFRSVVPRNQASMSTDHHQTTTTTTTSPPNQTSTTKPIILQSLLASPRSIPIPESDSLISPTSILDSCKPFSPLRTSFLPKRPNLSSETKPQWDKLLNSKGIGVALIDDEKKLKPINGFKLRVQIPPPLLSNSPSSPEPKSPAEFGTKTTRTVTQLVADSKDSPRLFTECLSVTEMELSEDYTCVISRKGTNPKTTHIFDNCVVENYFCLSSENSMNDSRDFLSFCYTCKKSLEQKRDIFIYRGDKAFCSGECRYQEMVLDGGLES